MPGKLVLISGPSGTGKTTIVRHLLRTFDQLNFSISATTRTPRSGEQAGWDYYFMEQTAFESLIRNDAFIEYEEVYRGLYYGTLYSELERIWQNSQVPVLDIDVKGAINVKRKFDRNPLMIYIHPGSQENLRRRLEQRGTDSQQKIERRLAKAGEELALTGAFDHVIYNENLDQTIEKADALVRNYLQQPTAPQAKNA